MQAGGTGELPPEVTRRISTEQFGGAVSKALPFDPDPCIHSLLAGTRNVRVLSHCGPMAMKWTCPCSNESAPSNGTTLCWRPIHPRSKVGARPPSRDTTAALSVQSARIARYGNPVPRRWFVKLFPVLLIRRPRYLWRPRLVILDRVKRQKGPSPWEPS